MNPEEPPPKRNNRRFKLGCIIIVAILFLCIRWGYLYVRLGWDIMYLDMALTDSDEYENQDQIVEGALAHGMDVNRILPSGRTPLMLAASKGRIKMVLPLLDHGADIEVKDEYGRTPLICAASGDEKAIVAILLTHGARLGTRDKDGKTALDHAIEQKLPKMITLLKDAESRSKTPITSVADPVLIAKKQVEIAVFKRMIGQAKARAITEKAVIVLVIGTSTDPSPAVVKNCQEPGIKVIPYSLSNEIRTRKRKGRINEFGINLRTIGVNSNEAHVSGSSSAQEGL